MTLAQFSLLARAERRIMGSDESAPSDKPTGSVNDLVAFSKMKLGNG